jgi:hypothetical protein
VKLTGFRGIAPRTSPRLLGDVVAQVAENTNLSSGEARPLAEPELSYVSLKTGPFETIYKADQINSVDDLWFTWAHDVDVCRSPLPGTAKWIYSGDGEPRITTLALAMTGTGDNYPAVARSLGVPKPQTAPSVSPSGGTLVSVTRYYAYTFYDDWNQESAFSPLSTITTGKPDGTWSISGMDAAPTSSGTGTVAVASGVTTFTNTAAAKHWLRVGEEVVISGTTVAVTAIDSASVFKVAGDFTGATSWARKAEWGTCTKRLYRTTGTAGQWQLVAEGITTTTFSDNILDKDIPGDEALTITWELPPVDLKGVFTLPSGALCGFSGNETCFSEPFQPHAWPPEYRKRTDFPVVAAAMFTSGVVVGTTGAPQIIIGHEPGQMRAQPVTGAYPCLSKRSMASLGDSVGYATAHGYARIGDNGVDLLTKDLFTRDDWDDYDPSTMIAAAVRGRLYLMTQGRGPALLIFDYLDGTGLTTSDVDATALHADALTGRLYFSDSVNMDVREFDPPGGVYMLQTWKSKEFVMPEPGCPGAARVNFESRWTEAQYDALYAAYLAELAANAALVSSGRTVEGIALGVGDIGGDLAGDAFGTYAVADSAILEVAAPSLESAGVTFTLFVNGVPLYSRAVTNSNGFRLPSGYKHDTFAVQVQGQSLVKSIDIADTMIGLKGA